jgi:hypothetical protein
MRTKLKTEAARKCRTILTYTCGKSSTDFVDQNHDREFVLPEISSIIERKMIHFDGGGQ